jgi:hypothetical protein
MNVSGKRIRLDPKASGVLYAPEEWSSIEGSRMMRHKPTHTVFEIECDDVAMERGEATVFEFSARLVHVCDSHAVPSAAEQAPLARAAIAIFLQEIGAWKPEVREVPNRRLC